MRIILTLAVVLAAFLPSPPARAFDFTDARRLVTLSSPQISPDGSRVLFFRGEADYDKDRTVRHLMLLDVRTHQQRALTFERRGVSDARWSPDGTSISFLASDGDAKNPQTQIFVLRLDGGEARQVTHAKNGVNGYAWSPDGTRFAYTMQEDDPNHRDVEANRDAFQVFDNDYLHRTATPPVHAWLVGLDGTHARRLTSGTWSLADVDPDGGGDLSWSADGKKLAFVHYPTPFVGDSLDANAETLDVASGQITPITHERGLQGSPTYAPHGDRLLYSRNVRGDYANGVALFLAGGEDVGADIGRNLEGFAWNASGDGVWITAQDGVHRALWYRQLSGTTHRVDLAGLEIGGLGNTSKNGALVFTASTPKSPAQIFLLSSPHASPIALTDENRFVRSRPIARTVGIDWHATKGAFQEDGVLTYPDGWHGGKAPLVLLIHGGPQSASSVGWSTQRQIFASHGYFVFEPNYRGSTNLGDAYQHAIANDAGDGPGKDVMAGLAAVERLGVVDQTRIGVSGWSYGGYMTSWLIGHYHLWKAAVSGASLDDWFDDYDVAFYVYTDVPFFHGVPWNPAYTAEWRAQSPITYASATTTPTLIMGDIGDNNVPITNSFKLYHALKDNGDTVQFVAYPVAGHFPGDPVRSEDVTRRWLAWLDRYLK